MSKMVTVRFPNYHQSYCYMVPGDTRVGDVVRTPPNDYNQGGLATVVQEGGNWTGSTKHVLEVFRRNGKGGDRPFTVADWLSYIDLQRPMGVHLEDLLKELLGAVTKGRKKRTDIPGKREVLRGRR